MRSIWCFTSVSTCVSFFSTCSPSLGAQALRSVEVNDPSAGEKANREFIVDESDCPYFKLGVIQALRYRNPSVLFGDDCETGWMKQVCSMRSGTAKNPFINIFCVGEHAAKSVCIVHHYVRRPVRESRVSNIAARCNTLQHFATHCNTL